MSEQDNTNNSREGEDVEGHGIRSGRIDAPDTDDVEGHGIRSGRIDAPDTDDVEGTP